MNDITNASASLKACNDRPVRAESKNSRDKRIFTSIDLEAAGYTRSTHKDNFLISPAKRSELLAIAALVCPEQKLAGVEARLVGKSSKEELCCRGQPGAKLRKSLTNLFRSFRETMYMFL